MTNKKQPADELAALRAEVEALKAAQPKPEPTAEERERATREWMNEMHQMREGRMAMATPPSVVRDFAVFDDALVKGIALRDARAPTGPSSQGAIPEQSTDVERPSWWRPWWRHWLGKRGPIRAVSAPALRRRAVRSPGCQRPRGAYRA